MKLQALTVALAAMVLPAAIASVPASANPSSFVGTWNAPTNSRGVAKVVITGSGSNYTIHAYGSCTPANCDFGSVPLSVFSTSVSDPNLTDDGGTANFTESFATRQMTINLRKDGKLLVDLFTKFTDKSGRQNYEDQETMTKALVLIPVTGPSKEDCISYDATDLTIKNLPGTGYQLIAGGSIALQLLDNESDALLAKSVAAAHHQQCFVGRNNSRSNRMEYIMEYWK
jgi:hypothetical protein